MLLEIPARSLYTLDIMISDKWILGLTQSRKQLMKLGLPKSIQGDHPSPSFVDVGLNTSYHAPDWTSRAWTIMGAEHRKIRMGPALIP